MPQQNQRQGELKHTEKVLGVAHGNPGKLLYRPAA
jgi:hypothetical protein